MQNSQQINLNMGMDQRCAVSNGTVRIYLFWRKNFHDFLADAIVRFEIQNLSDLKDLRNGCIMDLIAMINANPNTLASPVNLIKDDYTQ